MPTDVIVTGAGVAGLTSAIDLARTGFNVTILEARDRVGGRIFTEYAGAAKIPIELGAEFIHGLPQEIWTPLKHHKRKVAEFAGENWCHFDDQLTPCDFFDDVTKILKKMRERPRDQSFTSFLEETFPNPKRDPGLQRNKDLAQKYVTGFNAADPAKVSVNWLTQQQKAEDKIQGDRGFHIDRGYYALIEIFLRELSRLKVPIHLNSVVGEINWTRGKVEVTGRRLQKQFKIQASKLVVTLPLGVLLAKLSDKAAIRFIPALPPSKRKALQHLGMGHVLRVTLHFKERFWQDIRPQPNSKSLGKLSFLFSDDKSFPTWWTRMPAPQPVITGWAPFRSADRLSGHAAKFVVDQALASLGGLMRVPKEKLVRLLVSAHFHDWQNDRFSRGAYSYVKVGGRNAPAILGRPLQKTLFFAGEATDTTGFTGTVHGAIASGKRAAKEITQG